MPKKSKKQTRASRVPDAAFVRRLDEIAAPFGSRSALARAAGLIPGSVQSYAEGSEPTRKVLVALARAAGVSIDWLADGKIPAHEEIAIPFFDLRRYRLPSKYIETRTVESGSSPFDRAQANGAVVLRRSLLERQGIRPDDEELFAIEAADDSNAPTIEGGDVLVVRMFAGLSSATADGFGVSLIYYAGRFAVRRVEIPIARSAVVLRALDPSVPAEEVVAPQSGERVVPLEALPKSDLIVLGRVVWVGGRL